MQLLLSKQNLHTLNEKCHSVNLYSRFTLFSYKTVFFFHIWGRENVTTINFSIYTVLLIAKAESAAFNMQTAMVYF